VKKTRMPPDPTQGANKMDELEKKYLRLLRPTVKKLTAFLERDSGLP
jgi:hypothetical protein